MTSQTAEKEALRLAIPVNGEKFIAATPQGGALTLDFDPSEATFERTGDALVIKSEHGGDITLTDFFKTQGEPLPAFVLADGTMVAGADFLNAQSTGMDISTYAEASPTATGSGLGHYSAGEGDLLGGIERMGSLGTNQWAQSSVEITQVFAGHESGRPELVADATTTLSAIPTADPGSTTTPGPFAGPDPTAGTPSPQTPDTGVYSARAVLHVHPGTPVQGQVIALTHTASGAVAQAAGDAQGTDLVDVVALPTGEIGFTPNAMGEAWLQANPGKNLVTYFRVGVPGGEAYTVQVVLTPSTAAYRSADFNGDIDGFSPASGGLVHGEWHSGSDVAGSVVGALKGQIFGAEGAEPVHVSAHASGAAHAYGLSGATLGSGEGNDTLTVSAVSTGSGGAFGIAGKSVVTTGDGQDFIEVTAQSTGSDVHAVSSASSLNSGDGNDTVNLTAVNTGSGTAFTLYNGVTVQTGEGADSISLAAYGKGSGGAVAMQYSSVVDAGAGDDTIRIHGEADGAGQVRVLYNGSKVLGGEGNDLIDITGHNTAQSNVLMGVQSSTVSGGAGDDTVNIAVEGAGTGWFFGIHTGVVEGNEGNDSFNISAHNTGTGTGNSAAAIGDDSFVRGGEGDDTFHVDAHAINGIARGMYDHAVLEGGEGKDNIHVHGETSGTGAAYGIQNYSMVDGGSGDDRIVIEAVTTGSGKAYAMAAGSEVHGGAGNDTIIIDAHAAGGAGKAWAMVGSTVDAGDGDDHVYIKGQINTSTIDGGSGSDVLHLDGIGSTFSLTGSAIHGFETIDLGGGSADTLTVNLNDLLSMNDNLSPFNADTGSYHGLGKFDAHSLDNGGVLVFKGDENDVLKLGQGIHGTGHQVVDADNNTFSVYSYSDQGVDNQFLLVQTTLLS